LGRAARSASFSLGLLSAACGGGGPPPIAPAPALERPSAAIPADLDVAFRIDLEAARRFFGPAFGGALEIGTVDAKEDPGARALVSEAFEDAETVWIAFRPGLPARLTDNVLVFRGNYSSFDPRLHESAGFRAAEEIGGGFVLYARPPPARRSSPSRIYERLSDWLVFVSEAEVDSAERAIERRARDARVDPPERGIASFAARVEPLLPLLAPRFPLVAEALTSASTVEGSASADDRGLLAGLAVHFPDASSAEAARGHAETLVAALRGTNGLFGTLAKGTEAAAVGSDLVLRIALDGPTLARVVGCLGVGEGC
jgi:hypothetical protein